MPTQIDSMFYPRNTPKIEIKPDIPVLTLISPPDSKSSWQNAFIALETYMDNAVKVEVFSVLGKKYNEFPKVQTFIFEFTADSYNKERKNNLRKIFSQLNIKGGQVISNNCFTGITATDITNNINLSYKENDYIQISKPIFFAESADDADSKNMSAPTRLRLLIYRVFNQLTGPQFLQQDDSFKKEDARQGELYWKLTLNEQDSATIEIIFINNQNKIIQAPLSADEILKRLGIINPPNDRASFIEKLLSTTTVCKKIFMDCLYEEGHFERPSIESFRKNPSNYIKNSNRNFIRSVFLSTYLPDGIWGRLNLDKIHEIGIDGNSYQRGEEVQPNQTYKALKKYLTHPLTIISYFLGLPNRPINNEQSFRNLFYNFIGWRPSAIGRTRALNSLLIPGNMIWHLIKMPFKATLNIIKLATEFLPQSLYLAAMYTAYACDEYSKSNKKSKRWLIANLFALAKFATLCFASVIHFTFLFLGSAATSPIGQIERLLNDFSLNKLGKFGKVLSLLLATLSMLTTICIYSALFAGTAPLIASYILPHLPAVIVNALNITAQAVAPMLVTVGNLIAPIATALLHYMTLTILPTAVFKSAFAMSSAVVSGLGALLTLGALQVASAGLYYEQVNGWMKSRQVTKTVKLFSTSSGEDANPHGNSYRMTNTATLNGESPFVPNSSTVIPPSPLSGPGLFDFTSLNNNSSTSTSSLNPRIDKQEKIYEHMTLFAMDTNNVTKLGNTT